MVAKISFVSILTMLCMVHAQGSGFQAANKALARQLDNEKVGLQVGSPCPSQFNTNGAVLCAGNELARCMNGQVSGPFQSCGATLSCQVLPLVNRPGISVTCTTDVDKNIRIGDGSEGVDSGKVTPLPPPTSETEKGTVNDQEPVRTLPGKSQTDDNKDGTGAVVVADPKPDPGQRNKNAMPIASSSGGFQTANKVLARQLDNQKAGLQVGTLCPQQFSTNGAVLCSGTQLARCTNGQVTGPFQSCSATLSCQVLPLVNSPGVSVTCTTDEDKNTRIGDGSIGTQFTPPPPPTSNAGQDPRRPGKSVSEMTMDLPNVGMVSPIAAVPVLVGGSIEGGAFQASNKALARQLDSQKTGLVLGSPCPSQFNRDGAVLCAGNELARCNGGQVFGPLQTCGLSLNCQVLPLVNSPGVSVTCTTDADKNTRING